ncbi:hypothetical protein B0G83_105210 [Paraburkholderia sp. BL21I4N1]|nr:hypothetical protein B0G83_105210 [Paraburkholderia sp. BL21I4N1]
MMTLFPADWLSWSVGGGLSLVFLWLISLPPMHDHADPMLDTEPRPIRRAHTRRCYRARPNQSGRARKGNAA